MNILQGCDKVVTRLQGLHNLVTTLSFLYGLAFLSPIFLKVKVINTIGSLGGHLGYAILVQNV